MLRHAANRPLCASAPWRETIHPASRIQHRTTLIRAKREQNESKTLAKPSKTSRGIADFPENQRDRRELCSPRRPPSETPQVATAWNIATYKHASTTCRSKTPEPSSARDVLHRPEQNKQQNLAARWSTIRERTTTLHSQRVTSRRCYVRASLMTFRVLNNVRTHFGSAPRTPRSKVRQAR